MANYNVHDADFKRQRNLTIFVVIVVGILAIGTMLYSDHKTNQIAEEKKEDGWCEIGVVNPDGSITVTSNEQHGEYLIMARANDVPLIMAKCDRN